MTSEQLHEPEEVLGPEVVDRHRAIASIMEELEAVDWYDQRVAATSDPELAEVLGHNRDEEKEHAAMTLEWLRRRDPELDRHLRTFLFTEGSIVAVEDPAEGTGRAPDRSPGRRSHLHRHLAPLSGQVWQELDDEVDRLLGHYRAGRALVDVVGPLGWSHSAVDEGRVGVSIPGLGDAVVRPRMVRALSEVRVPFTLDRTELEALERGAADPDLAPLARAARDMAAIEDRLVFDGLVGDDGGLATASPHDAVPMAGGAPDPAAVADAVAKLREAGIEGPYALALGSRWHRAALEAVEPGLVLLDHLRSILGGRVIWAPGLDGAVVTAERGGDHELVVGQEPAIGYAAHDGGCVELFLEGSLTFRVHTPEAAVRLRPVD